MENPTENIIVYPGLLERIKALIADSVVITVFMLLFSYLFKNMDSVDQEYRIIASAFVFIFYEPLSISIAGGTIGHHISGIRVKRKNNPAKNIIWPLALLRFTVKTLLGFISLIIITMNGNEKRQAIHDLVSGSIVVYKS